MSYKNKEVRQAYFKKWVNENREKVNANNKKYYQNLKDKVFDRYGKRCWCCGETEEDFLTLEHLEGGGSKHRKEVGIYGQFLDAIHTKELSKYMILCMNCNMGRAKNYGVCPHILAISEKLVKNIKHGPLTAEYIEA